MKKGLVLFVMLSFVFACNQYTIPPQITPEAFQNLHFIIERSSTDTIQLRMNDFISGNHFPSTAFNLKPGRYTGDSPYDDFGYRHSISFRVENGKFTDIGYDEIKENGHKKSEDTSYCRKMNESVAGSAPNLTYPNYIKQLESKQDFNKIDAVTGATYSKFRFQLAAMKAIMNGPVKSK